MLCGAAATVAVLGGCNNAASPGVQTNAEATSTAAFSPLTASELYIMDNHDEALPFWVAKGVRGATLVHVDAHDDFRKIEGERLAPVIAAVRSGDATAVAELADNDSAGGAYNLGDYVYAAVESDVVDKVIWVVPAHKGDEPIEGWKEWLRSQRFAGGDIDSLRLESGVVTGTLHGVPIVICTPDQFAPPSEDVLLDIDVDFFPVYSATLGQSNPLGPTHDVLAALLGSGMRVRFATVASSVSGDYLDLQHEWLADVVATSLVRPDLLFAETPPVQWGAMGEAVSLEGVDDAAAAERWREAISADPESASAWYGLGRSLLATGEYANALDAIGRAVQQDRLYAYGWLQTAAQLSLKGDARALEVLDRAEGDVSPFLFGVRRADVLYNLGRYAEAAKAYERLSGTYDHPDVWMYLGDTNMKLGRLGEAETAYIRGMQSLERVTFRSPEDYVESLPTLGRIAEQEGRTDLAKHYYEIYLEKRPEGADVDEMRQRLERLSR